MELERPEQADYFDARERLSHRVRHMFAVVRSLVMRSGEQQSADMEEFAAHVDGRIAAFARVQTRLLLDGGSAFDLEELLRDELLAQTAQVEQYSLEGPHVALAPRAAEVLALAFHELATNATKFGALSQPDAKLSLRWRVDETAPPLVTIEWEERGVAGARHGPEGFGFELLMQRLPYELSGTVDLAFTDSGLRCIIAFPIAGDPTAEA